jgi:signal transduction histidine kinase/tetratricopeptide (TPR) repeat protein
MRAHRKNVKPTFWWQGLLILLPLLVLTVIGFVSLRQDRMVAEREAEGRAREVAEQIASRLGALLDPVTPASRNFQHANIIQFAREFRTNTFPLTSDPAWLYAHQPPGSFANYREPMRACVLDTNLNLIYPPPMSAMRLMQVDESVLGGRHLDIWKSARELEFRSTNTAAAISEYGRLLAEKPSDRIVAEAQFSLGLLHAKAGNSTNAALHFAKAVALEAADENIALLQQFARLHLLKLGLSAQKDTATPSDVSGLAKRDFETFGAAVLAGPTSFSTKLLEEAAICELQFLKTSTVVAQYQALWKLHEECRDLAAQHRSSQQSSPTSLFHWLQTDIARIGWRTRLSDSGFDLMLARPVSEVREKVQAVLRGEKIIESVRVPEYFGVEVSVQGEKLADVTEFHFVENPMRQELAEHKWQFGESRSPDTGVHTVPGESTEFYVRVFLTRADLFYAQQRRRQAWFAGLIGISTVAALVGFVSARRSFLTQLRLNEMKGNFVSSVSHELRAPIASVRLMAEGLEQERITEPAKQKEYFRFIGQECRRLSSLIENVLDFSRIEQGRKQYEFEPTDIVKLITETVKLMEPNAIEKGVRISLELDASQLSTRNPQPILDGRAMQQALINLIDNAIKHSPNGAAVTVAAAPVPSPLGAESASVKGGAANALRISVQDHGPGVPKHEQEKIFERFYRLGSELRRETQGVGIGLSIVKHIVEAHEGRVMVDSEAGKGSRFTIEVPFSAETRRRGEEP